MKSGVKGSSHLLPAHWEGGARASIEFVIAKNPVRPSKGMAEGGCGGNSAVFLQKIEASPAALLVQSRTQQKSFLFLLEEKIRRAQIRKSEENFFAGLRVVASGGGLASLVPFKVGSSKVQNIPLRIFGADMRKCGTLLWGNRTPDSSTQKASLWTQGELNSRLCNANAP